MISAVLFISFFIFLILGVPIALCLGLSSVCAILYSGTSLTIVAPNMYSGTVSYPHLSDKDSVIDALSAGAIAVSSTKHEVWIL